MSGTIVLLIGIGLSFILHFVGVYAGAKKIVWITLALLWMGAINVAMSEIKPKGYAQIEKMKGDNQQTDALISQAHPEISVYEMLEIKKSYLQHKKGKT